MSQYKEEYILPDDPKGIVDAVSKAPNHIKAQAAIYLLTNGAKPRDIRKKLKMSNRQFEKAVNAIKHSPKKLYPNGE